MSTRRNTTLVTGASVGLGLAIARRLLDKTDDHLILTARESSLGRFADEGITEGHRVWLRRLDITDAEQRSERIREIEDELGGLDALVNNAGITYRSVIEHVTDEERRHQMEVNYQGPMGLSRLAMAGMRRRRRGRIVQVSSAGGLMAMPTMGIYAASKFALEAATEAMYYELRPFGVKVSLVLPGFINSDGFEKVLLSGESRTALSDPNDPYYLHYQHMVRFITKVMRRTPSKPESVAKRVVSTLTRRYPPLRVPATWDTRLLWWFRRFAPQRFYHFATYRMLPGIRSWGEDEVERMPKLPPHITVEHVDKQRRRKRVRPKSL